MKVTIKGQDYNVNDNQLAQGIWPVVVVSGVFGETDKGMPTAQIDVKFTDGPNAGRLGTYRDDITAKSAPRVGRSCKAVGWQGKDLLTLKDDVTAWIAKTGGATAAEVRYVPISRGRKYDEAMDAGQLPPVWDKINSIGYGPKPLAAPSSERLSDANEAMRQAMAADGSAPADAGTADEDIPFASSAVTHEPSAIARVLR